MALLRLCGTFTVNLLLVTALSLSIALFAHSATQSENREENVSLELNNLAIGLGETLQQIKELQESLQNPPSGEVKKTFEVVVPKAKEAGKPEDQPLVQAAEPEPIQSANTSEPKPKAEAPVLGKEQRQQQLDAAVEQYKAGLHHFSAARAALKKARAQTDPGLRHHHMRMAEENASWAKGIAQKLDRILKGEPSQADAGALHRKVIRPVSVQSGSAYRQLLHLSGQEGGEGDPVQNLFDASRDVLGAPADRNVRPKDQNLFGIRKYPTINKADPNLLEFEDGKRINIRSLRKALKGKPFARCGDGEQVCPSSELLKFLADDKKRQKLEKVGGVALQTTFSMLENSGIADFRGGVDINVIENPVLISLKRLYAAAKPYADDGRWAKLPEKMRYPGSIDRVHGFVLDPEAGDIFLIGTPAGAKYRRIDIDSLILALRITWRDGLAMGVSLDPHKREGDWINRPRFIDVPRNSIPAKIMIEADYAMKVLYTASKYNHRQDFFPVGRIWSRHFQEVRSLDKRKEPISHRMWLSPKRLGTGSIFVSQSGRSVLLSNQIEVLTERLLGRLEEYRTGEWTTPLPLQIDLASELTDRMPLLEASNVITPRGVFARLRGLGDLVAVSSIMRTTDLNYELIGQFAEMPYRPLGPDEAIPASYPFLTNEIRLSGKNYRVSRTGGADLLIKQASNAIDRFPDPRVFEAEKFVISLRNAHGFVHKSRLTFGMPERSTGSGLLGDLIEEGIRAFYSGNTEKAQTAFEQLTDEFPESAQGWSWLAKTLILSGDLDAAHRAISKSFELSSVDPETRMVLLDITWRRLGAQSLHLFDAEMRRMLGKYYAEFAVRSIAQKRLGEAGSFANWAVQVHPDGPLGHLYLGSYRLLTGKHEEAIAAYSEALELDPETKDAHYLRAYAYMQVGQYGDAVADLTKAVSVNPQDGTAFYNRGNAFAKLKRFNDAIADYTRSLEINPADAWAYNNRGAAYKRLKKFDLAMAEFDRAIEIDPNHARAYQNRGSVFSDRGDFARAIDEYSRAIEIDPTYHQAVYNRGMAHAKSGAFDLAIADITTSLELNPDDARAFYARGSAHARKGDHAAAIEDFSRAIELKPDDADYIRARARSNLALDNFELATKDFGSAVDVDPKNATAIVLRGYSKHEAGDYNAAIADFNEAIAIDPASAPAYFSRGEAYRSLRQYERAIEDYDTAITIDPKQKAFYFFRGRAFQELDKHDPAIDDFTAALALDPKNTTYLFERGYSHQQLEQTDAAIADFSRVIETEPDYATAYRYRGDLHVKNGRHERAIKDYSKVIKLRPKDAAAYLRRGKAYAANRKNKRALKDFSRSIKLDSDNADAYRNRSKAYAALGNKKRSARDLRKANELSPNVSASTMQEVQQLIDNKEFVRAIAILDEALSDGFEDAYAFAKRGYAHLGVPDYEKAIADFTRVITIDPSDHASYNNRGFAKAQSGEFESAIADYDEAIKLKPNYVLGHSNRGDAYHELGKYEEAIADFDRAIALSDDPAPFYYDRGRARRFSGDLEAAIADFDTAIELGWDTHQAHRELGIALVSQGEYAMALTDLNEAIRLDQQNHLAYFHRAVALSRTGWKEDALDDLARALELAPAFKPARAVLHFEQGQFEAAVRSYSEAIAESPHPELLIFNRALALVEIGDFNAAITDLDRLITAKWDPHSTYLQRGISHAQQGEHAKAIKDFDEVILLDQRNHLAYYHRAISNAAAGWDFSASDDFIKATRLDPEFAPSFRDRGIYLLKKLRYGEAVRDLRKAVELAPNDEAATKALERAKRLQARLLFERGKSHARQRQTKRALEDFKDAIELRPGDKSIYVDMGDSLLKARAFRGAIDYYGKAIDLDADFARAYRGRGLAYRSLGNTHEAGLDLNAAIRVEPDGHYNHYLRADLYRETREYRRAIAAYGKAIELKPDYAPAYGRRALLFELTGDKKSAIADYQRLSELNPSDSKIRRTLDRLMAKQ